MVKVDVDLFFKKAFLTIIFLCCKMKKKILVTCLGFDSPHPKKALTWPESVKRKTITTALLSIQIPSLVRKMSKKKSKLSGN